MNPFPISIYTLLSHHLFTDKFIKTYHHPHESDNIAEWKPTMQYPLGSSNKPSIHDILTAAYF